MNGVLVDLQHVRSAVYLHRLFCSPAPVVAMKDALHPSRMRRLIELPRYAYEICLTVDAKPERRTLVESTACCAASDAWPAASSAFGASPCCCPAERPLNMPKVTVLITPAHCISSSGVNNPSHFTSSAMRLRAAHHTKTFASATLARFLLTNAAAQRTQEQGVLNPQYGGGGGGGGVMHMP